MEQKQDNIPEQNGAQQELTSIERARELFAYEMTEVLLNFRQEVASMQNDPAAEYLRMELPKSGVDYAAPEIAVEGIAYRDSAAAVSIDSEALRTELTPAFAGVVPDILTVTPPTKTAVSLDAEAFAAAAVSVPAVQWEESPKDIFAPTVVIDAPSVPAVNAEALFAAPPTETVVSVAVPDAQGRADFAAPAVADVTAPAVAAVPSVDASQFAAEPLPPVAVGIKAAQAEDISLPPLNNNLTPPSVAVELPAAAAPVLPDLPRQETALPAVAVPKTSLAAVEIAVPPVRQTAALRCPDVPEQPDYSAYYAEILQTLQAE